MGKKSNGKEKSESKKGKEDIANSLNEIGDVNDMLQDGCQLRNKDKKGNTKVDVGDDKKKEDKKHKKRKLELESTEEFLEDTKKGKSVKHDEGTTELGNKEKRKKDKRPKYDSEGSDIGNDKNKRKDRTKKKDKYDVEAIQVEQVSIDLHMEGVEMALKDNRTSDGSEVSEMGYKEKKNKKRKDRKNKKDENDVEPSRFEEVLNDTRAKS